jgi:hypothetical protein
VRVRRGIEGRRKEGACGRVEGWGIEKEAKGEQTHFALISDPTAALSRHVKPHSFEAIVEAPNLPPKAQKMTQKTHPCSKRTVSAGGKREEAGVPR